MEGFIEGSERAIRDAPWQNLSISYFLDSDSRGVIPGADAKSDVVTSGRGI